MIKKSQRLPNPHYLPTRLFTELHNIVQDLNIDIHKLLETSGLSKSQLVEAGSDTAPIIGKNASEQLIKSLLRLSGKPNLGFVLGQRYHFSSHDIVGFAALAGENLGQALCVASKYFPLITHLFELKEPRTYTEMQRDLCVIEIESLGDMVPDLERVMLEAMLANMHVMAKFIMGDRFPSYQLELPYILQEYHQDYANSKSIHISGEHPKTRIIIPSKILSQALPLADALSLEKALKQCDTLLALCQNRRTTLSERILACFNQKDSLFLSQETIAKELNISTRAMHRQLNKEGKCFRDIATQARVDQAKHLLRETEYSISQVGHELGYSDAANFTRAFKKLVGVSPKIFREHI